MVIWLQWLPPVVHFAFSLPSLESPLPFLWLRMLAKSLQHSSPPYGVKSSQFWTPLWTTQSIVFYFKTVLLLHISCILYSFCRHLKKRLTKKRRRMRSGGSTNKPQPPLPGSNEKDSEAQGLDEEGKFTSQYLKNTQTGLILQIAKNETSYILRSLA